MTRPRALVLRAPGINCERETAYALETAGADAELVHVKALCATPARLDRFAILVVPGGFSYGDDIAAGRVLANQLRQRLGDALLGFVDRGGLVLGICNGFQVLARLGLLPRTEGREFVQQVTLSPNLSDHYECRWVTLASPENRCVFVEKGLRLRVPAAHGEGYVAVPDAEFCDVLEREGYVAFHYVDAEGRPTTRYPENPNGSPRGIAGLTDRTGQVLGLMPHPDRAFLPFHPPDWRRTGLARDPDGMSLFRAVVRAAR